MQKIKIEIVSDVVCPWCYIGKRRIEKAIDQLKDQFEFDVSYLPFELNAQVPKEGQDQKKYLANKFGSNATEGLQFDFNKQKVMPNTRDAHRIIWLAKQTGKQSEIKGALLKAYFEEGVDLSKPENLVAIAVKAGLNEQHVWSLLKSDEGLAEVITTEQQNQKRGVSGVPFYIINDQYGISGAQPTDVFIQALTQIGSEVESANACDVETKAC